MSILTRARKMLQKNEAKTEKKSQKAETATATETSGVATPLVALESMLTEKSMRAQEKNTVVFRVHPKASKGMIAAAIKAQYGVKPLKIRTAKVRPKMRRRGLISGFTNFWKKAYVTVEDVNKFND